VLQTKDTGLKEGMKTQDTYVLTYRRHTWDPRTQTIYKKKVCGQVPYTSETEKQTIKQMDSVWVPWDSQQKIALSGHREFFLFGISSSQP